jgi:lipoprotein-anchoring transpeptidase ErfK/SrfK
MRTKHPGPWVVLGFVVLVIAVGPVLSIVRGREVAAERARLLAAAGPADLKALRAQNRRLGADFRRAGPRGPYIVIDTGRNVLTLKRAAEVLREAVISTGSGDMLEDPTGKRSWVFDTPRGVFSVKALIRNPYWVKPDWAFIEEDKPVPKRLDERVEGGVLGDYALSFGNGFFIHGTLYTRMLGRNVTHGCIRVGDADLEAVFRASAVGTRIFIF